MQGPTIALRVAAIGPQPMNYEWRKNGVYFVSGTNTTLPLGPLTQSDAGSYNVVITSAAGLSTTSAVANVSMVPGVAVVLDPTCMLYTNISASSQYSSAFAASN